MPLSQRHTTYIRCRAPELWSALTEGQTSRQYFFDAQVDSTFEPGAPIRYMVEPSDDPGALFPAIEGEILSAERERKLAYTLRFCDLDEPATTVSWMISAHDAPGVMRVDVLHEGFAGETEGWQRIDDGWPVILSGLKTWLETGEALGIVGGPAHE